MFNLFQKKNLGIKLISIHIPKTAGTSFGKILQANFNEKKICWVYEDNPKLNDFWNYKPIKVDKRYSVIHGHIPAYEELLCSFPNAKLITWLRNPVDRIVSYYFFWLKLPKHGNPIHDDFLEKKPSISDFARLEFIQNEVQEYLLKLDLNKFYFIGIFEKFEQELYFLSKKLGLKIDTIPHKRATTGKQIQPKDREELEFVLKNEMNIYKEAIELSKRRSLSSE